MYREIIFLQEHEADEVIEILSKDGPSAAVEYLSEWDNGEGGCSDTKPWGKYDDTYKVGSYVLAVNSGIPYVSLTALE